MAGGGTYPPLFVPKPVAPDLWIVDGPEIGFYGIPFPTRMTVVRLPNGDLWLHSPIPYRPELRDALQALGPIRHLVAPNWLHYAYLQDWGDAVTGSQTWLAPGVADRAARRGVRLRADHGLTDTAPDAWADVIEQRLVTGSDTHREFVFFHRPSRSLILTDLIEAFEPRRLPWYLRVLTRMAGNQAPGGMPRDMRATFDKATLRHEVQRMIDWGPERVLLSHGQWHPTGGVTVLRRVFAFLDLDRA